MRWIKIYRKLINWEWYHNSYMVHVFMTLLLLADTDTDSYGEVVISLNEFCGKTGLPRSTIRNCLKRLEECGCISQKVEGIKARVITILNYASYQGISDDNIAVQPQPKNYISSMKTSEVWRENIMMKFGVDKGSLDKLLDDFALDCKCNDKHHTSEAEARRHFVNWLNKQKEINKTNGEKEKYNRRRAADVTATSAKDFEGRF